MSSYAQDSAQANCTWTSEGGAKASGFFFNLLMYFNFFSICINEKIAN